MITWQIGVTLALLVGSTVLFALDRIRPDLIAILVMILLGVTGILEPEESFSGFSSPAVVVLISAFIISAALTRVGVSRMLGDMIARVSGRSETRLVGLTALTAASLSLIMNNVAAAAVLLPGTMDVTRRTGISPSRVLIPLAFAIQLGGMATLLTTANIVASATLRDQGLRPFGMLEFLPVGGPIALVGVLYVVFGVRRRLPRQNLAEAVVASEHKPLSEIYDLHGDLFDLKVLARSPLVGKTLEESGLRADLGLNVVVLQHPRLRPRPAPSPTERFRPDDILTVHGPEPATRDLEPLGLERTEVEVGPELASESVGLVEVVLSPRSSLAEKTLRDVRFRERYRLTVVAVWRNGAPISKNLGELPLQFGDALLVHGTRRNIDLLQRDGDFLVLTQDAERVIPIARTVGAIVITLGALLLGITGVISIAEALLTGAALLVLTRCLTMEEGYRGIEWRAVVLIGAMLPIGIALAKTGAADLIGGGIASLAQPFGPWALLAALTLLTVLMAQMIPGGAAVPLVVVPLAVAAALRIDANPRAFAMAVALAASASMLSPFAHPVSAMVMGLGGYTVRDYFRAGLPVVILATTLIVVLVPLVAGLR